MKDKQFKSSWWVRRAVYVAVALLGLIAAGFGLVDEGQLDAVAASPLLATFVGAVAAAFTHKGSNSTVTAEDVALAAASGHGGVAPVDPDEVARLVVEKIDTYGKHAMEVTVENVEDAADELRRRATSVAEYYGVK